uniref:Auxin-responsive protein n=1 Tax=Aegilops tauschii TaxID=37682 RepID=M8B221_AEGTA
MVRAEREAAAALAASLGEEWVPALEVAGRRRRLWKKRLVGWPPVKSAHRPRSNSHVKVKMEGVPIGRKVDLSRHASYHQLHHTLRLMFPSSTSHHGDPYAVTYEEGDGDWMLVGDVPWE